jgi:hypothetical protein
MTERYDIFQHPPTPVDSPPIPPVTDVTGKPITPVIVDDRFTSSNSAAVTSYGSSGHGIENVLLPGNSIVGPPVIPGSTTMTTGVMYPPDSAISSLTAQPTSASAIPSINTTVSTSSTSSGSGNAPVYAQAPVIPSASYGTPVAAYDTTYSHVANPAITSSASPYGTKYLNADRLAGTSHPGDFATNLVVNSGLTTPVGAASSSAVSYQHYDPNSYRRTQESIANYTNTGAKLQIRKYTDKSFIVSGDTREHYSVLKTEKDGSWIGRPKDSGEKGWCYSNTKFDELRQYVEGVNSGTIGTPAPTVLMQTLRWDVFKPNVGMKVTVTMPMGKAIYIVSSIEQGYPVVKANIVATHDVNNIQEIVIINGQWQIRYFQQAHTIEPIVETSSSMASMAAVAATVSAYGVP